MLAVEQARVHLPRIKQLKPEIPLGVTLANMTIISALRYAIVHAATSATLSAL